MAERIALEAMEAAESIALRAGWLVLDLLREERVIETKASPVDIVTDADRKSEAFIAAELQRRFPDHAIVGEEGGERAKPSRYRWHVDPVDGTTNYAHGFPIFCVSIALCEADRPIAGVIRAPMLGETFKAAAGAGAYLNGRPIRVSACSALAQGLVATGFPKYQREKTFQILDLLGTFIKRSQGVRRPGAAAIDLAYVACGRLDGYWEEGLSSWDTAAGLLLVEEAGGRISDYRGNPYGLGDRTIVASNGRLHDEMIDITRGYDAG